MTARRIVVVDVETTGLRSADVCVEVAWWDLNTDERGLFIPTHSEAWVIEHGQPDALELNGYRDRILGKPQDTDNVGLARLHHVLRGQRLAGANPSFDARHLRCLFMGVLPPEPWHHRLLDLSAYAAGVLGLDPGDLLGCAAVCDLVGVSLIDAHTAEGDVTATGLAFKALMARAGVTTEKKEQAA